MSQDLIYSNAVDLYNNAKTMAHKKQAAAVFQQLAQQGYEPAVKTMHEVIELHDVTARTSVSMSLLKAHTAAQLNSVSALSEAAQDAIDRLESLFFPNDDDKKKLREAHRYMALALFLTDSDTLETLKTAKVHFDLGQPVTECEYERIVFCHLYTLRSLLIKTKESTYGKEYCQQLMHVRRVYFERFQDIDYKELLLFYLIEQECSGEFCEQNLEDAQRLSKIINEYSHEYKNQTYTKDYETAKKMIADAYVQKAKSGAKSFIKGLFK